METKSDFTLHPVNYQKLKSPLKIFFQKDKITKEQFDEILEQIAKQKTPLAISGNLYRNTDGERWGFNLYSSSFCLYLSEAKNSDNINFSCSKYLPFKGTKAGKWYHNPFAKMFLVDPAEGIYFIRDGITHVIEKKEDGTYSISTPPHADWSMDSGEYYSLLDRMHAYFLGEDELIRSRMVSKQMEYNVLAPFENFTQKEHEYEERQVDYTKGLPFFRREFKSKQNTNTTYIFCSNDEKADPENTLFSVGNKLVVYTKDGKSTGLSGLLVEIDDSSDEKGVLFYINFYQQFDDERIPETGYLCLFLNDSQAKIRRSVATGIRTGRSAAEYMYKTFHDFSVQGYSDPDEDLVPFLEELLKGQYPPNQMQMETIIKGILTKDLLLVLGPPGTGKTTVILSWVRYFLKKGVRVLISSQNNAAVDNVLERFKGQGEILRLGREDKVQENCREFLLSNKAQALRKACAERHEETCRALAEDKKEIERYRELLTSYIAALEEYEEKHKIFSSLCHRIDEIAAKIKDAHVSYIQGKTAAVACREQIARDRLYLEEYEKKNAFLRFFLRPRANAAEQSILSCQAALQKNIAFMNGQVDLYHNLISRLGIEASLMRRSDSYGDMKKAKDAFESLHTLFLSEEALPSLQSAVKTLYKKPDFTQSPTENLSLCRTELEALEKLASSAEKIEFASGRWAEAALKNEKNTVFEDILIDVCQIVGATCIGINSNKKFANVEFGVSIIDESGQIQIHNALVPMSRAPITLMLGDYKQIPPIANDEVISSCENDGIDASLLKMSFFEFLFEKLRQKELDRIMASHAEKDSDKEGDEEDAEDSAPAFTRKDAKKIMLSPVIDTYRALPKKKGDPEISAHTTPEIIGMVRKTISDRKKIVNLNSQFRMPENISGVISRWFYESNYFSSYDPARFTPLLPGTKKPIVVIDTGDAAKRGESRPASKMGYQNQYEAKLISILLERMFDGMDEAAKTEFFRKYDERLGIISAYGAQVRLIRNTLSQNERIPLSAGEINAAAASLDSFQGQERDLIIYSLTRSDRHKSPTQARIGFLKELRRLNVAFTRAKKQLVIIGDMGYLTKCLYMVEKTLVDPLPCAASEDSTIGEEEILQCADCPVECERRFARFLKLLKAHVLSTDENGETLGDWIDSADLDRSKKGEEK